MPGPRKAISVKDALIKAQLLCARQEKCESDIRNKLYEWRLNPNEHDSIIDLLKKEKYIDEQRYAIFYTKDKFNFSKWGRIKIEYSLKQKNIPHDFIQYALSEIQDNEYDQALKNELVKKFKTIRDTDEYTIKSKLVRFAISRGFENGKVFDMVSTIIENEKKN